MKSLVDRGILRASLILSLSRCWLRRVYDLYKTRCAHKAFTCVQWLIYYKSYPKSTFSWDTGAPSAASAPLFPISQSSSYPTSKMIHNWLQKSRLSEQELGVEHVEMLLDTLIFDGEIERLPAYGAGMWDMGDMDQESEEERKEKRRKKKEKAEQGRKKKARGKKRSRNDDSSGDEDEDSSRRKKRRKVKKEDDSDDHKRKSKSKSKSKSGRGSDDDSASDSDSEDQSDSDSDRKKSRRRKKSTRKSRSKSKSKLKRRSSSPSSSSESDTESESNASESSSTSRKRKKRSSKSSKKTKTKSVFDMDSEASDADGMMTLGGIGSTNVYRAVRQERVSLGWSQAPCGRCPVFDFCHEGGPVNPKECTYYGDWLQQGIADF